MTCTNCGMGVQPEWAFCPGCATEIGSSCASCGKELQTGWKACPFCGTAVGDEAAPPAPKAAAGPVDGLVVAQLAFDVWGAVWEDFFVRHNATETLQEILAIQGADSVRATVVDGMRRGVTALREAGIDTGDVRPEVFAGRMDLSALRAAEAEVHKLDVPESTAGGAWQGALNSVDPRHKAGQGAVVGATIGSIVPGIGTAIGAGVGAMVGQHMASSDDQGVLERADQAFHASLGEADDAYSAMYDAIAANAGLPRAAQIDAIETAWAEVDADVDAVRRFIRQHGRTAQALEALAQLEPDGRETGRLACELYPWRAQAWEALADASLEVGDAAAALHVVQSALADHPHHEGLRHTEIQALAATGRPVRPKTEAMGTDIAYLAEALGHVQAGAPRKAIAALNALAVALDSRHAAARLARKIPALAELKAFPDVGTDRASMVRGLIDRHLGADGHTTFLGLPPGEAGKNARREVLQSRQKEKVFYFFDWSMWTNGNNGLALTDKRLVWKCAFEDPVEVPYNRLQAGTIGAHETWLAVNDEGVDAEQEHIAAGVAAVLIELLDA